MAKPVAIKPEEDFARSYVDRLILEKLSEMESAVKLGELADKLSNEGIGLATVRSLLASNPDRFAYHERRWVPSARLKGTGRPMSEAITLIVGSFGGPVPFQTLLQEVARVKRSLPEELEGVVRRIIDTDQNLISTPDDRVLLARWGFQASDESVERALALNQVSQEEFEEAKKKLESINWRESGAVAKAVKVGAPISLKALGAVAWSELNSQDPRSVLLYDERQVSSDALTQPGFAIGADCVIYPEAEAKKWITTAVRLADRLAPTVEVEDAAPIEVKPEDVQRLLDRINKSDASVTATKLLEDFYEITPGNKTFPDDLSNMMATLKSREGVQWVGGDRLRKAGAAPDFIYTVPEPFMFDKSDLENEEGDPVDAELTDEGLSSSLRKLLAHPLATDVLDEDIQPAPKTMPESLRLVLKSIHRELGTFPLSQIPTGWLDAEPEIQELIFVDPTGRELQVWVNQDARLMYNLIDWWYEQPVESGAVFSLTKTNRPNVLEFAWLDQPDPVVYISSQRMEELRRIGETAEGKSTLELLIEVMAHWPKGADYLTILAEVNVVRRSSRRLIASLLSSYQCFYQRSGSPVWHFDAKKVEQGFDKTKKKFIKK